MSIAKIKTNHAADATLQYVVNKAGSHIIGGNVAPWVACDRLSGAAMGTLLTTATQTMQFAVDLNQRVKRPIYHISLSFHPNEDQDDIALSDYCEKYLAALILTAEQPELLHSGKTGASDTVRVTFWDAFREKVEQFREQELPKYSYLIARHRDQAHPHAHIVCSRVNLETTLAIPTSYERYRSQVILRDLEQQFGLVVQPNSWEVGRRALSISQIEKGARTQTVSVQQRLQDTLERVAQATTTVPDFIQQLQLEGVEVRVTFTRTGKSKGISYGLDGVSFAGHALGNRYSFKHSEPGLVKHLGLRYQPERDQALIKALCQDPGTSPAAGAPTTVTPPPIAIEPVNERMMVPERQIQPQSYCDELVWPERHASAAPNDEPASPPLPGSPQWQQAQQILTIGYAVLRDVAQKQPGLLVKRAGGRRYEGTRYWLEWDVDTQQIRVGKQGESEPFVQGQLQSHQWAVTRSAIVPEDWQQFQAMQHQLQQPLEAESRSPQKDPGGR